MSAHVRKLNLSALMCIFLTFPCRAQVPDPKLPDPAEGNVNGLQGVNFVPVDAASRLVDPTGCVVVLVPGDVNKRLSYECGKWFAPPPDRYTVWLEQGQYISDQTVLQYPASRFNGLSLEPSTTGFDKRLQPKEATSVTRLPEGRAMSGIFDADGNALALSRPFLMEDGKIASVKPQLPVDSSDLMIILGKSRASVQERAQRKTSLTVLVGETRLVPDVMYETDGRIIAVWYALKAKNATLSISSEVFHLADKAIFLPAGTVTTVREQLGLK